MMNVKEQITMYITAQPKSKRCKMQDLHQQVLKALPKCKLWFLEGKGDKGKIVSHSNR
jgi:hypothetical protein